MDWNELYPRGCEPTLEQVRAQIQSPLWDTLRGHLETLYGVLPHVEHSVCSGAPGWNVKYRKGGRALCTLYPHVGYFTCMVVLGTAEATGAELALPSCTPYVQALYNGANPMNGARWLMVDVTQPAILEDVERLIALRCVKRKA